MIGRILGGLYAYGLYHNVQLQLRTSKRCACRPSWMQ